MAWLTTASTGQNKGEYMKEIDWIYLEKRIRDLERINAEQKIKIDTLLKQTEYLEGELCIK